MPESESKLVGVDTNLSLYELTDLFYAHYRYHNEDCLWDYSKVVSITGDKLKTEQVTLSRFQALRRSQLATLGSRPFLGGKGIAKHRPNVSLGYHTFFLAYSSLPYKAFFSNGNFVEIRVDKPLYDADNLSENQQIEQKVKNQDRAFILDGREVSEDVADAFYDILHISQNFQKIEAELPKRITQDGVMAFVHSDVNWDPVPVPALDLVTEPQCDWEPKNWSSFFVIRKMKAQEAVRHIKDKSPFWRKDALRWALESAQSGKGLLTKNKHSGNFLYDENNRVCGENFMVKSFMADKAGRTSNINSYYGNMYVVEAYYINDKQKVNKAIFFPSTDFLSISSEERKRRANLTTVSRSDSVPEDIQDLKGADVLFFRENVAESMEKAVTVIPYDRSEPTLERQRPPSLEIFSALEIVGRLDSSIINFAILQGVPFIRDRREGTDAQNLEDLEIMVNGEMVDLGDRDFVQTPFQADLNSMLAVRRVLLQHVSSKIYLGGLDGDELKATGGGAERLATLRLVGDARVLKHNIDDFAKGIRELLTKMFITILELNKRSLADNPLIQKRFFDYLTKVRGHSISLFEFDNSDIIKDTGLPYWIMLDAVRNGGSHFGPAELVILSEVKNMAGDGMTPTQIQRLNRMIIKSLLGTQDEFAILGDPKEAIISDQDQIYMATLESAAIVGSIDEGGANFKPVPIRVQKDDHIVHLQQVHNPDAIEIIQRLQEGDVTPNQLDQLTEEQLDTRINLILRLAALAAHIQFHQDVLEQFGGRRDDINRLREETNAILQTSEGLLNNLQVTIRASQQKKQDKELRLRNISPENEAEKMKQQVELSKLQIEQQKAQGQLSLANKIADQRQQQHIDKQVSKARDRSLKRDVESGSLAIKQQQNLIKAEEVRINASKDTSNNNSLREEGRR